jgi:Flp pilus assembly pilin Flp
MQLQHLSYPSRGQGLIEYALIIALVAIVVIATLTLLEPQIGSIFQSPHVAPRFGTFGNSLFMLKCPQHQGL